jgi:SHS2 domain-containing protein
VTYEWVEHTAELELRIEAADQRAVFEDAFQALVELLDDESSNGEPLGREIHASAADPPALLAEWMMEVVFLAETEGLVPERLENLELAERHLSARVSGRRGNPPHIVKAVTYHGLVLEPFPEGWRARLVLDV